jgi:hypothetical protein
MDFTSLHRLASDQASGLVAVGKGATIPITNVEEALFSRCLDKFGRAFGLLSENVHCQIAGVRVMVVWFRHGVEIR